VPELPEVETIARDLGPRLAGVRILDVRVIHHDVIDGTPERFREGVTGLHVVSVKRRGKNVVIRFEDDSRLVVNLGMTGRLVTDEAARAGELSHVAVRFLLGDGHTLLYDDTRRFGRLQHLDPAGWRRRDAEIGLEPLGSDLSGDGLWSLLRRTRSPVRSFLLDQRRVAGIGNIYALEALFRAGIRPTRRGHRVTRAEAARLHHALRTVLTRAIESRGTTFSDYRDASGEPGSFAPSLLVYDRAGEPCPRCGTIIKRKVLSNRSAYYCPSCQT
jgi:formamidopyrimidine-DNA glycosylase